MNPVGMRWFGVGSLTWTYYDRDGRLVREVLPEEVPTARLGQIMDMGGVMVMADPQGGWYAARWAAAPGGGEGY